MNETRWSYLSGYRRAGAPGAPLLDADLRDPRCPQTGTVLEAVYDLDAARATLDRDRFVAPRSMWDFASLLPVRDPYSVVSLAEGATPLLANRRLGKALGFHRLWLKDESRNPTGSFKDRGASVTVSWCREVGHRGLCVASSGNLACSLACYAAAADLEFHGFIREDTSAVNLLHALVTMHNLYVVPGGMLEGVNLASEVAQRRGLFHAIQPYNLFRVEGKKTLAYEICAELKWSAPDRVLVPTSGCTNALALHKGFAELIELGWIDRMPCIDLVQVAGCAPVVDAWEEGRSVAPAQGAGTELLGMGHPFPSAGDAAVAVMRATGGRGLRVSDEDAYRAQQQVARHEGLFLQPASVLPVAALAQASGFARDECIVWIGTGSGKNQIDGPLERFPDRPRVSDYASFAAFAGVEQEGS